jgi:hypothetical protein
MDTRETLSYICSSLEQSWNPLKWHMSMKIAAVTCALTSIADYASADESMDNSLLSEFIDKLLANNTQTFHVLSHSPEQNKDCGMKIAGCLKRIQKTSFLLLPSVVPADLSLELLKYFQDFYHNTTVITVKENEHLPYLIMWQVGQDVLNSFNSSLVMACEYIKSTKDLWSSNLLSDPIISIWSAFGDALGCAGVAKKCAITQYDLFEIDPVG